MLGLTIVTVAIGAFGTWLLLRFLIPQLCRQLPDQPNARSSHSRTTPRGGGLAFVFVASASSVLSAVVHSTFMSAPFPLLAAPLLALPLALIGLLDDRFNLPATWRYGVQLSTALLAILMSPLVALSAGRLPLLALLVIAVTAVINFTNFMDGLDGLVAGCMAVAITGAAIQLSAPFPLWALVGGLLGFLPWNWSPAKVFMGDVGSTFLGAVFALLVLQASTWSEALGLLLVATPLLGDACLCVPRRLIAGQQVFQAHRLHLYQRLHQAGWTHAHVSSLYIAATASLAIAVLWGGLPSVIALALIELLMGFWLDQRVAVRFAVASCN
jgi:Fuc2NAc and GlcNAc transferase